MTAFEMKRAARRAVNRARYASTVVGYQRLPGGAPRTVFADDLRPKEQTRRCHYRRRPGQRSQWLQTLIDHERTHAPELAERRRQNQEAIANRPVAQLQPSKPSRPQCAANTIDGTRCSARVTAWRDDLTGAPILGTLCRFHSERKDSTVTPRSTRKHRATRYTEVKYHSLGRALLATDLRMFKEKKRLTGIYKDVLRRFAAGTQQPSVAQQQALCALGIDTTAWQRELDPTWLGSDGLPLPSSPTWVHESFSEHLAQQVLRYLDNGPFEGTAARIAKALARPTAYIRRYLASFGDVVVTSTASGWLCVDLPGRHEPEHGDALFLDGKG